MGIKAIDSEGLMNRTRRYEQSNVFEMFSDIRKINKACIKADQALAESGLGEFSSLGYEDLSGKITKIQNDLSLLEQVPGFIISEFIDQDDTDFALLMSNEVLAELNKLHMDEISLNGKNLSDMQSLKDKTANKDESKMVISERDLADMIILYETNLDVLNSNEKEKYNLCFSLMLARSNTQIPYTQNEVKSLLTGCTRTEKEGIIRTICKDYETVFGTNPKEWSEKSKQFLVDYSRHLLPEKMSDVENIDTTQLVAFNNAIFEYGSNVDAFLIFLFDESHARRENNDYWAKVYYQKDDFDKYNEEYYAYYQLERLWGLEKKEFMEWEKNSDMSNIHIDPRFIVSKIHIDLGKEISIEGTKQCQIPYMNGTRDVTDWKDYSDTFCFLDRQLTYTEEEFDQYLKDNGWTREEYYSLVLDQFTYLDMFDSVLDDDGELAKDEHGRIAYDASSNRDNFASKLKLGYVTIDEYLAICSNNTEYNARYLSSEYNQKLAPRKREFDIVFNAIRINPDIGKMQIAYASRAISKDGKIGWDNPKYHEGTDAFAIKDGEKVYVACRGTSDREWVDDGLRACVKSSKREDLTQQMNEMLTFFEEVGTKEDWDSTEKHPNLSLIVTGHPQGGNDAQMLTLLSKYRDQIETCYSFDGEGHSPELIRDLKKTIGEEKYNELIKKMYNACGQEDYVHPLAENVILLENMKYVKLVRQDGVKVGLTQMHDQVSMFAQENPYTGEIEHTGLLNTTLDENGDKLEAKISEKITGALWNTVKEMPPETREKCAVTMLSLFQGIKSGNMEGIEGRKITVDDALYFLCNYLPREEVLGITTFKLPEPIKQEVKQTIRKVDGCYDVARIATAEMVSDAVQVYQQLKDMGMNDELIIMDVLSAF